MSQSQPAKLTVTLQDTECDRYRRMFEAACVALGEIGDALGCDPNEGGSEPILDAVDAIKAVNAELLEALKLCAAVCAGETSYKRGLVEALEAARAALTKAEGAKP